VLAVRVCPLESNDPTNRRFGRTLSATTSIGLPKKSIKSHNNARSRLAVTPY
jgi:hypothetical protein